MMEQEMRKKLQCLLSLNLSLLGLAVAFTVMALDVNVAARTVALVAALYSGWGCCHSLAAIAKTAGASTR